jgi:subtilisin
MSDVLTDSLKASGVASVIVILNSVPAPAGAAVSTKVAAAGTTAQALSRYFVSSELSHESALLAAKISGGPSAARPHAVRARSARPGTRQGASATRLAVERPAVRTADLVEPPPQVRVFANLGVAFGTVDRAGLAALRKDPTVQRVTAAPQISLIRPHRVAAARLQGTYTWGLRALGVSRLWDQGLTGKGIRVGHLDTGVDGKHPALQAAVEVFAQFDDFGRQVIPDPEPWDSDEHGTHTAATIAGRPVSGRHMGVANGAALACAMVIEGGQIVARVLGGMDWAVGRGARVLSMSLGLRGYWPDFESLTTILRSHGVLPVFAVGNEGPGTSRSPGNYADVMSVGAVDRQGDVADFSSSQRFARSTNPLVPDVVAPGVHVISAKPGGGFQAMDGTSMATPHIAGLAALLFEAKPDATVDDIERAISNSAALGPVMPPERAGMGLPDATRALAILRGS